MLAGRIILRVSHFFIGLSRSFISEFLLIFFLSGTYDDDTLESSKSVLMNNVNYGVPIVSLRQRSIHRLGLDQKIKQIFLYKNNENRN